MEKIKNCEYYIIPSFLNSRTRIIIGTAIFYYLLNYLSQFIFVTEIKLTPFYPAIGFAIAAAIIFGRKAILGVAIGSLLFSINSYISHFENATTYKDVIKWSVLCLIRLVTVCLNAFLVPYFTQLWCKNKYPFNKGIHVLYFAAACLLGSVISISISLIPLINPSHFSVDKLILIWSNAARATALGAILFTPFVLSWFYKTEMATQFSLVKKAEAFILVLITVTITVYAFETKANNESFLFFLLIWAASRFGIKIITTVALIITIISIYYTGHQMGGFVFNGWDNDFLMLQLFLFVNITSILFLKAILNEKEDEESKLKISEQNLNLEKNIFKATIENPNGISIFSLDTDLNYISFNSVHSNYMKSVQGVDIKIGDNHPEIFLDVTQKEETIARLGEVLKGNICLVEVKTSSGDYISISKSPIKNKENKIIGITTIITDITELKLKEIQLEKNNLSLNERIKELRCLHDISETIGDKSLSMSEKMEISAQTIPKALQFPEKANCRILFMDKEFISINYQKNDRQLIQPITVNGDKCGVIEVGYFNAKKEHVFLDEEIKLLETLSDIFSRSMERKLAEENLKISEEKFRAIYESFDDIYFKKTIDGTLLDVSPSIEKHFNLKREFVIGQNAYDFYADRAEGEKFYQAVLENQQVNDYEERFLLANGEISYFSVNAKVVYNSAGEPAYFEGTMRDVNERIQNRKKLLEVTEKIKESEEKYRSIFENTQDVYYMHYLDGRIFEVSPSIEKHFKYTREEMIGKYTSELYFDTLKQNDLKEKIITYGYINDEHVQFVTGTGEPVYFSVNCKIIFDQNGVPSHIEGSMRNINDRIINQQKLIKASEKIKQSEEKFRSIYENMQDVYYLHEIDGTLIDMSPSVEKQFHLKREDLIGKKVQVPFADPNRYDELIEILLRDGYINDQEIQFLAETGEAMYCSVSSKLINDSNGNPTLVEGTMRNISERVVNQKQLLEATEKIRQSEEKFRSIYENMQDVYYLHDLDGMLLDVSPSVEKQLKYKREEMIGRYSMDFHYDQSRQPEFREKIIRDGYITDENIQFVTATGEPLFFSVNCKIIFDQNGIASHVEGSMRNINERIVNQQQLLDASEKIKESEEKFRSIYENMEDVYFLHHLDGKIIDISPSAEKVFQIKKEEFIGAYAQSFHSDVNRHEEFQEKLQKDGLINDQEVQFLTATGETIYFSVNAKLIHNSNYNCVLVEGTMRNINERINNQNKLIEATEKIKRSEEEFRAIFESFEDIYFRTSLDGIIQNVSPSVEKILKFKREDVINTPTSNLYLYPEDRFKILEVLKEKGYINDFETVLKDKDNNPVHLSTNGHLVYDSRSDAQYIEGTIRDISERKKNELEIELANQTIKESEQKYRTIFNSVRDVFFRASAKDHKIIDISPSCTYFDMKPEDIIGKSIEEFYFNPEDRIPVLNELMHNAEIKNYNVNLLLNSKKYVVSINSKIAYDENNEPEFLIGSFRDISDRIQAEENLRISEAKFRSIFENFEDVYFKTTINGKILDVSPSFEKHFLKPCSFALENSVFDFYYDEQDRESLLEKLKKESEVRDFDARFRDGKGNIVFFSVNARLIYDENGEPIYIEKSMRNINDRVAFQKEMLEKNRTLEFQNTELEQFAYIASHDLQEPLITVIQFIELLQEELGEDLDEDQKQYMKFIGSSTSRMQLLVKGLLDYSRIGKERKTSKVDCNEILTNVLADMNVSLKESNAVVEFENLPIIEGNATEMRQLFQNLISNANKFRKKEKRPKIKIAAKKEESNWLFSIQDNGIGIEEQDKDKVFVIFKRLNNRNAYQGTGIGLSHCKKIIEHHKGKIWVESEFNEGSTFKWTLPFEQN